MAVSAEIVYSLRPRTHGNDFVCFCIVYCSQGNREQPAHYLKQYKNAGKRFRVYGALGCMFKTVVAIAARVRQSEIVTHCVIECSKTNSNSHKANQYHYGVLPKLIDVKNNSNEHRILYKRTWDFI